MLNFLWELKPAPSTSQFALPVTPHQIRRKIPQNPLLAPTSERLQNHSHLKNSPIIQEANEITAIGIKNAE